MKILRKSTKQKTLLISVLIVSSALLAATAAVHRTAAWENGGGGTIPQTPATFSNYEVAGNPFQGGSVGVTCPNNAMTCQNTEAEPAIRADRSGNFYGSSENVFCVIGGDCGGTWAYKSTDGGSHFTTLPLPDSISSGNLPLGCTDKCTSLGFSPAGGDTDLAVAPKKNLNGFYNIYVASLATTPPLANIYVSTSKNGGASWFLNPTGAKVPVDDREWAAADGADKVCISYHGYATTNNIFVDCSLDGGTTFTTLANAFDLGHVAFFAGYNNVIGNLAIDPHNHFIYQVFSSINNDPGELLNCNISCHVHTVWISVSIDGGVTFTGYKVYNNPDTTVDYGHQFINVSVDNAGNVYVVYDDNHNMFYSFSTNFGRSFSGPFQVNKTPSNTAIFPWSAAGNAGQLDIVWYGTSFYDGRAPDNYPSTAAWYVYFAQNLNALTPNSPFTQVAASGIIHYGGVCEAGVTCSGNRDLLDDFGVAASPTTGKAAIIYTSDQYLNTAAEPATRRTSGSYVCTALLTNTVDCSHTDIAIQTGGSTVNQKPHHFEVDDEDFEEMNLKSDGGHQPHNELDITNTGNIAINQFDVAINGLPWTIAWSSSFPVQPGQTATSITTSVPLGLLLAVGNIYPVTITAKLADGTTETQTINALYSLGPGIGL